MSKSGQDKKARFKRAGFLFGIQWLFSWLWPIKVARCNEQTKLGLTLSLYQGRWQLDTPNANYSYGNLQTVFENYFAEVSHIWPNYNSALILGFGLGGVCDILKSKHPEIEIIGVEIDPCIVDWHNSLFKRPNTKMVLSDAKNYLVQCTQKYDLIVVDVFEDLNVPEWFHSQDAVRHLHLALKSTGSIVFNKVVNSDKHRQEFEELMVCMSTYFRSVVVNEQLGINRIITANKPIWRKK